jgi:hypothetical protein
VEGAMGLEVENNLPPFGGQWGPKHRGLSLDQKGADPFYFSIPEETFKPKAHRWALRLLIASSVTLLLHKYKYSLAVWFLA